MAINRKTIVDVFLTRVTLVNYNIAEDINNLQSALLTLGYTTLAQAGLANVDTLAGNKTLVDGDAVIQALNPNTANRNVTLAAAATTNHPPTIQHQRRQLHADSS